jgi:phage terminase large subunit
LVVSNNPRVVEIPYAPRNWAKRLHASFKRWAVLILHRRAGKTTAILNHHVRAATNNQWEAARLRNLLPDITDTQLRTLLKHRVYWHVMPTFKQGKLTGAWDILKEITRPIEGAKPNESEMSVTFANGNRVQIIGADNPDSLRGPGLSGLSLDEYSQIPANAFGEVLSKALADHLGYAIFSGTIKGKDQLFKIHATAKDSDDWFALWQDVNGSLETETGATIEAIRRAMEDDRKLVLQGLMTQAEFDQEWFLSVEAAIKGAFYGDQMRAAMEGGRILPLLPYDPALPVDTDWDLGIDAMAIWFSQSERSGSIRLIDYHEDIGGGLPASIKVVKEKPYIYGKHWAPHDIEVREISSGLTRKQTAANMGLKFEVTPKLAVDEGINAAQLLLARCWFSESTTGPGLEALRHYRRTWNQRLGVFTEVPVHDVYSHGADAFRGLAVRHQVPVEKKKQQAMDMPREFAWG